MNLLLVLDLPQVSPIAAELSCRFRRAPVAPGSVAHPVTEAVGLPSLLGCRMIPVSRENL